MSDWYLARQLQNFQHGIRGAHRAGFLRLRRWRRMADALKDERAINDVVAYINTLRCRSRRSHRDARTGE